MAAKAKTAKRKISPASFDKKEAENGKAMSILAYFGILSLIPFFAEKKNKFVRLHACAGVNLLIIEVLWGLLITILSSIFAPSAIYGVLAGTGTGLGGLALIQTISWIGNIFLVVVSIIGIVNAAQGKYKDLPLVSSLKFVK